MKTMKKALALMLAFVLVMGTAVVGFDGILALKASAAETVNSADGKLHVRSDGSFTILQVADFHDLFGFDNDKANAIRAAINAKQPDLIVVTGDNITGNSSKSFTGAGSENASKKLMYDMSVKKLVEMFVRPDGSKIPFAVTFGNHDLEAAKQAGYSSLSDVYNLFLDQGAIDYDNHAITDVGTGCIPVYGNGAESNVIKNKVLIINSGSWIDSSKGNTKDDDLYGRAGDNENNTPNETRYQQIVEYVGHEIDSDTNVKVIAFQHIPLQEFYLADGILTKGSGINCQATGNSEITGIYSGTVSGYNETCCCSYESTKDLYLALAKSNTLGIFYGHDHTNTITATGTCYGKSLKQGYGGGLQSSKKVGCYTIAANGSLTKSAESVSSGSIYRPTYYYPENTGETYISEIGVFSDDNKTEGWNNAVANCTSEGYGFTPIAKYANTNDNADLQKNAGAFFILLGIKTTNDPSQAICDIKATEMISYIANPEYNGINYTAAAYYSTDDSKGDVNRGSGKPVYLYYTKDKKAGDPIKAIDVIFGAFGNLSSYEDVVINMKENNDSSSSSTSWSSGTTSFRYPANMNAYTNGTRIFLALERAKPNTQELIPCAAPVATGTTDADDSAPTIVVPDTIYVNPTDKKTFQHYLNNDTSGAAVQGAAGTTGSVYFSCSNVTGDVSVSLKDGTTAQNLSISKVNNGSATGFTGSLSTALAASTGAGTGTKQLEWEFTYTYKGETRHAYAYTTVYSPYESPIGASAMSRPNRLNDCENGQIAWVSGAHSVSDPPSTTEWHSSTREITRAKTKTTDSTYYLSPLLGEIGTTSSDVNPSSWFNKDVSGRQTTFVYSKEDRDPGNSYLSVLATGYTANITVDTSRNTNLSTVPNFKVGAMVTTTEDINGLQAYALSVYSKNVFYSGWSSDDDKKYKYFDTLDSSYEYSANDDVFKTEQTLPKGVLYNDTLDYDLSNATNTVNIAFKSFTQGKRSWKIGITYNGYSATVCYCPIKISPVSKSTLRSTVMGAVKHDKESCANWDTYISQLKSASSGLGDPTSTTTSASVNYTLKSTSTYTYDQTTITFDPNGGTLSFSPATVTMNAQDAGTFSYDASGKSATRSDYDFIGWSINKYDTTGSTGDVTVGKDTTLYAIWEKDGAEPTFSVTVNNDGGYERWSGINNVSGSNGNIALFSPFKPGYKFLGWTGSNGNTAQKDVSIPKGASGSLSYTANWEEEKYENTVGSIRNGDIDKGIYDSVSFSTTPTATYGQFSGTSNVIYRPTNMAQGANIDTITGVTLNYVLDGEPYSVTDRTVKYYPQTNVLYEIGNTSNDATGILSSGSGLESGHVWTNVASTAANVNALDSSIYGYAQAYAGDSGYSNGSAMKVTVSEADLNNVTAGTASWPTYRFKMVGTGFDVNAHCGSNSGLLTVCVYTDPEYKTMATYEAFNPITEKTVTQNYSKAINTYFNDGVLYQTPVVHFENMPYGTYYVECKVAYNKLFDKNYIAPPKNVGGESEEEIVFTEENGVTYADLSSFLGENYSKVEMVDDLCEAPAAPDGAMLMDLEPASVGEGEYNPSNNSYEVTIDSVRIYNPAGVNLSSGDIYDRYTADDELNPTYSNLRAGLLTKATDATGIPGLTGTLYIEKGNEEYDDRPGIGATTGTTTAYKRNGSVNEIYLTTGSAIALDVPATGNVHIALRSPKGGTVVAQVGSKTFTINTATELYYDVTDALTVSGGTRTLTVTLQSGTLLAIGELKTFGSAPSNAPARLSAKSLSAARIALNEAEEHPLNVPEEITFTVDFGDAGSAEITLPKTRLSFDLDEETGKWIASAKLTAEEVAALFEENADTDHYTLDNAGEITVKATQEENGWEAAEQKVITNEIAPETEDITFTIDLGKDYGVVNVVIPADELKCEKVNGVWTASANVTVEQLADLIAKAGLSDKIKADEAITVSAENVDGVWVVEIAKAPVSETPVDPGTDEPGTDEPGTDEPGTDEPGTDDPTEDEPWYSWIIKLIQKIIEFFKTIFQRIKLAISGIMN